MDDSFTVPEDKVILGLTGNIATGKSAVMRLAAAQGALTIDADKVVHEVLAQDPAVKDAIRARFGDSVFHNGEVNRPALGAIVFGNPDALQALEQIIHPAVYRHVRQMIAGAPQRVIMIEAIKLLEGKLRPLCRQIWVTDCTRACQLERLKVCRGMEETAALARMDAQAPQLEKVAQADVVIDTNGLMRETEAQFRTAWAELPAPAER